MSCKPLLCPAPVERLTRQLQLLPSSIRQPAWRIYALLRRKARAETLGLEIPQTTQTLVAAVNEGLPFRVVTLAVQLAQTYTREHLNWQGASQRAGRAHARESFFLVRQALRHALGHRVLPPDAVWSTGATELVRPWRAVCDGSQKTTVSSAGVVVYDDTNQIRAEVSVTVPARTAVDAELHACIHALRTLLGLGCRHAVVEVDSQSVMSGLAQTLPLKYCLLEAELGLVTLRFDALRVRLVPRVSTYPADRMAARLSRH